MAPGGEGEICFEDRGGEFAVLYFSLRFCGGVGGYVKVREGGQSVWTDGS